MMKKISLILFAALSLAACQKSAPSPVQTSVPIESPEKIVMRIQVESAGSKVLIPGNESQVNDLQILVFGEDGKLETYARESGSELSLECTSGIKDIYAFVNGPSLNQIQKFSELSGTVFSLDDASPSHLPMQGFVRQNIRSNENLTIEVKRMVCKISLREILTSFPEAYVNARLEINKVYLTNAVSAIDVNGTIQAWANKLSEQKECEPVLCDNLIESKIISASDNGIMGNFFYTFANATAEDNCDAQWSPRFTRLVIEGKFFNGTELIRTCYYPIPIGPLVANHSYVVSQYTISRPGLSSPADNPQLLNSGVSVTVTDWEETHEIIERL